MSATDDTPKLSAYAAFVRGLPKDSKGKTIGGRATIAEKWAQHKLEKAAEQSCSQPSKIPTKPATAWNRTVKETAIKHPRPADKSQKDWWDTVIIPNASIEYKKLSPEEKKIPLSEAEQAARAEVKAARLAQRKIEKKKLREQEKLIQAQVRQDKVAIKEAEKVAVAATREQLRLKAAEEAKSVIAAARLKAAAEAKEAVAAARLEARKRIMEQKAVAV